jgi:hypothetical protein
MKRGELLLNQGERALLSLFLSNRHSTHAGLHGTTWNKFG